MNSIYYIVGLFFGFIHAAIEIPFFMHHMAKMCLLFKLLPYEWEDEHWDYLVSDLENKDK